MLRKCVFKINKCLMHCSIKGFNPPGQTNEEESHAILDRFVELGGNFIDSANAYSLGESERILGTWLAKYANRPPDLDIKKMLSTFSLKRLRSLLNPRTMHLSSFCRPSQRKDFLCALYTPQFSSNLFQIQVTCLLYQGLDANRFWALCNSICGH